MVSPTLFNLYLDRLDKFITTEVLPASNRGKRRTPNRAYRHLHLQITRLEQRGHHTEAMALRRQLQQLPARDPDDPAYRRLRYVRYADLCRARHKSAYAGCRVMPTALGVCLADQRARSA